MLDNIIDSIIGGLIVKLIEILINDFLHKKNNRPEPEKLKDDYSSQ